MGDYDGPGGSSDFSKTQLGKIIPELTHGVVYTGHEELDAQLFAKQFRAVEISDDEDEIDEKDIPNFTNPPPKFKDFKKLDGIEDILPRRPGMVLKRVIKKGWAGKPPIGSKVIYLYAAFCEGKTEPFDSSSHHEKMSNSIIGDDTNILGIRYALESMWLGEIAQFYVHYDYAFGELGCPPRIPGKTNIFINIHIKDFHDVEMMESVQFMDADKRRTLPFQKVLEEAQKLKADANNLFGNNDNTGAVRNYRKASRLVEEHWDVSETAEKDRAELREVCYSNMAQAYINIGVVKAPQACNACKAALSSGSNLKAFKTYFRFAKAKMMLQDYDHALKLIKEGAKYTEKGEKSGTYKKYEKDIKDFKEGEKKREINMCKKMFGGGPSNVKK